MSGIRRALAHQPSLLFRSSTRCPMRFGGGGPTVHDHSQIFSRALSVSEQMELREQQGRVVSGIVPGKMFMRHWIAGEQSTFSIVYRGVMLIGAIGGVLYAGVYASSGLSVYSWVQPAVLLFGLSYLLAHTHRKELAVAALATYILAYLMW